MKHIAVLCFLLQAVSTGVSSALDQYLPETDFRKVSKNGRYYVVVKQNEDAWSFWYVKRHTSAPPVSDQTDGISGGDQIIPNPRVIVRTQDHVVTRGKLLVRPLVTLVSGSGQGFVALGNGGPNFNSDEDFWGKGISSFNAQGRRSLELGVKELFTGGLSRGGEIAMMERGSNSLYWLYSAWLNEDKDEVVIVSERLTNTPSKVSSLLDKKRRVPLPLDKKGKRLVRRVNLKTGVIRRGSLLVLHEVFSEMNLDGLDSALELIIDGGPKPQVKAKIKSILSDPKRAIKTRIRAAAAQWRYDDQSGKRLLREVANGSHKASQSDVDFAAGFLAGLEWKAKHGNSSQ